VSLGIAQSTDDKKTYGDSIDVLKPYLDKAKMGDRDKLDDLNRLSKLTF
jgi:hypothetical protein